MAHTLRPDGLGDNVLVQVLPDPGQPDWTSSLDPIFHSSTIPQKSEKPAPEFRNAQLDLVENVTTSKRLTQSRTVYEHRNRC